MNLYDEALLFAIKAHGNQKRWNGDPYIIHPVRVAIKVGNELLHNNNKLFKLSSAYERDDRIRIARVAALLHDTIEDTPTSYSDIRKLAGSQVANIVNILTRQWGESYENHITRIIDSGNTLAREVKLADLRDNLSDIDSEHSLYPRYISATRRIIQDRLANRPFKSILNRPYRV